MRIFHLLTLGAVVLGGCDTNFWDPMRFPPLHNEAPVQVTHDPGASAFPLGRYGALVVGYPSLLPDRSIVLPSGRSPNLLASRFVASGGASSAFYVWRGFEDRATSATATTGLRPVFNTSALYDGCRDREFCGDGASSSIAAFDVYPGGIAGGGDDFSCIAVPAGAVGLTGGSTDERLLVRCETTSNRILALDVTDGIAFGASSVGLPAVRGDGCAPRPHGVGLALFGAPGAHAGLGAVYVARVAPGIAIDELDLTGLPLPASAGLGAVIAAAPLDDTRALVAVSARSEAGPASVVVMTVTGDDAGLRAEVHACLSGAGAGFGRALAIGDLDGDGSPELAVGGGALVPGLAAEEEPIALFAYDALSSLHLAGCMGDAAPTAAHALTCQDIDGLTCADPSMVGRTPTGFGAALAIGDLDADGTGDLVIGAPHARIAGIVSGAIVSVRGEADLTAIGAGQATIAPSSARAGMLLGYSVSTLRGTDRDEIVAGAPGSSDAMVFFCSGLPGDRVEDLRAQDVSRGCVVSVRGGSPASCASSDAGVMDAGVPDDASPDLDASSDAGEADAGDDAGADAGDDAG